MSTGDIQSLVRDLADREAIRDLVLRYAHYVWEKDVAAIVGLFTDDGEMDTGDSPTIKGKEALLEAYQRTLAGGEFQPFVHNHVIDLRGDAATGTCYLDLRASVDGRSMIGSGQYRDRYDRVGDQWKFSSRRLTMSYFVPLSQGWVDNRG